jgi:hypothetical protein
MHVDSLRFIQRGQDNFVLFLEPEVVPQDNLTCPNRGRQLSAPLLYVGVLSDAAKGCLPRVSTPEESIECFTHATVRHQGSKQRGQSNALELIRHYCA